MLVGMTSGFRSKCEGCEGWINEGDDILWDPENRVAFHVDCADEDDEE